jgi:subtilisin family serine protease
VAISLESATWSKKPSGTLDERGLACRSSHPNYGSGSSFASPQVAGVAALVWTVRPDLTMQQVRQILLKTAGGLVTPNDTTPCPANDSDYFHAPVDAYAAVLAADCPDFNCDLGVSATPASSPVRMAILDVAKTDNGQSCRWTG